MMIILRKQNFFNQSFYFLSTKQHIHLLEHNTKAPQQSHRSFFTYWISMLRNKLIRLQTKRQNASDAHFHIIYHSEFRTWIKNIKIVYVLVNDTQPYPYRLIWLNEEKRELWKRQKKINQKNKKYKIGCAFVDVKST